MTIGSLSWVFYLNHYRALSIFSCVVETLTPNLLKCSLILDTCFVAIQLHIKKKLSCVMANLNCHKYILDL